MGRPDAPLGRDRGGGNFGLERPGAPDGARRGRCVRRGGEAFDEHPDYLRVELGPATFDEFGDGFAMP